MVKIILVASMLGMVMFSGCSSDTVESITAERLQLFSDLQSGKISKEDARKKGIDLRERLEDLQRK